jgi:hypothetical protein
MVVDGIRERRFWLLTNPAMTIGAARGLAEWMDDGAPPLPPMAADAERMA